MGVHRVNKITSHGSEIETIGNLSVSLSTSISSKFQSTSIPELAESTTREGFTSPGERSRSTVFFSSGFPINLEETDMNTSLKFSGPVFL